MNQQFSNLRILIQRPFAAVPISQSAAATSACRVGEDASREPTWNHTDLGWDHMSSEVVVVFVTQMHRQSGLKPPVRPMALWESPVWPRLPLAVNDQHAFKIAGDQRQVTLFNGRARSIPSYRAKDNRR